MKNKQIINKYEEPIFSSSTIYIVKNANISSLTKLFDYKNAKPGEFKSNLEENISQYTGLTYYGVIEKKTGRYVILIILTDWDKYKPAIINTLAHESLHAAFRMMQYNEIDLDKSTNELFANLVGWITECCYKTYYKK